MDRRHKIVGAEGVERDGVNLEFYGIHVDWAPGPLFIDVLGFGLRRP